MTTGGSELTRRAWRALSELALDRERKIAVADALGLSWTRVLTLRRLAVGPLTQRELADRISADQPYVTLMIDDLERQGLVRRTPHPSDRRAKLVELTDSGRSAARRAEAILDDPPAELSDVPKADLEAVVRVLGRIGWS
jgi:DNA-binding MarR family transcriptional regulator